MFASITAMFDRAVAFILSLLVFIFPIKPVNEPLNGKGNVTVTAHSGCMGLPDNSIEAMEKGIEAGAQIVEFDLNYTAEGEPVLNHDTPENPDGYVTLAQAFEFLSEHKDIRANVDVKSTAYLEKLEPLAEEYGVTEQLFFTGLNEDDIPVAKEKAPNVPYYLNTGVEMDTDLEALAKKAAELGAIGINLNWKDCTIKLVKVCHSLGLEVSVWTVNEERGAKEMALIGVDNITSRNPDMVCEAIAGLK